MCFQETLSASDWTIWHFHRFTGWCEGLEGSSRGHLVHPPSQHGPIRAGCTVPCVKGSHSFSYKLPFQFMQMISEIKINKQQTFFPCRPPSQVKFSTVVWTSAVWTAGTNLDLSVLHQATNVEILLYLPVLFFFFHFYQGFLLNLSDIWWKDCTLLCKWNEPSTLGSSSPWPPGSYFSIRQQRIHGGTVKSQL